jgi:UDP-2,3-diacylglucosamine pyrophosphatase LpxH
VRIEEIRPPLKEGRIEWLIPGDIHADTKATRVEALYQLVDGLLKEDALRGVIFQGDTLDRDDSLAPKEFIAFLKRLGHHGLRIVFLPGNHDPNIKERLRVSAKRYGMNLPHIEYPGSEFRFEIKKRQFLVLHGDVFDDYVQKRKRTTALATWIYDKIQSLDDEEQSTSRKVKKWTKRILRLGKALADRAMNHAEVHGAQVVICGHVHIAEHLKRKTGEGKLHYFNTGCFTSKESYIVAIRSSGRTKLHRIRTKRK